MRLLLLLPTFLFACKDKDGDSAPADTDPAAIACEHRTEAGTAIASAASADDGPEIEAGEPYTVSLIEGASGYLTLETEEPVLLFLGTEGVITGLSLGGEGFDLPASEPNEDCPADIPEHYDLEAGSWRIKLGPSALSEVWLMVTEAGGHGGH